MRVLHGRHPPCRATPSRRGDTPTALGAVRGERHVRFNNLSEAPPAAGRSPILALGGSDNTPGAAVACPTWRGGWRRGI